MIDQYDMWKIENKKCRNYKEQPSFQCPSLLFYGFSINFIPEDSLVREFIGLKEKK